MPYLTYNLAEEGVSNGKFRLIVKFDTVDIQLYDTNGMPYLTYNLITIDNPENLNLLANYAQLINLNFPNTMIGGSLLLVSLNTTSESIIYNCDKDLVISEYNIESLIEELDDCTLYKMLNDVTIHGKTALMGDLVQFYEDKTKFRIIPVPTNSNLYGRTIFERSKPLENLLHLKSYTVGVKTLRYNENYDPPRYVEEGRALVHNLGVTINQSMWNGNNDNSEFGFTPNPNFFNNGDIVHWKFAKTHNGYDKGGVIYNTTCDDFADALPLGREPYLDNILNNVNFAGEVVPLNESEYSVFEHPRPNYYNDSYDSTLTNIYPTEYRQGSKVFEGWDGEGFFSTELNFNMFVDPFLFEYQHMQVELWVTDPQGNIKGQKQVYEYSIAPENVSFPGQNDNFAYDTSNYGCDAFTISTTNNSFNRIFSNISSLKVNNVELVGNCLNRGTYNYNNSIMHYFFNMHRSQYSQIIILENRFDLPMEVDIDFSRNLTNLDPEQKYSSTNWNNKPGWASENIMPFNRWFDVHNKALPNNIIPTTDNYNFNYHDDSMSFNYDYLDMEKEYISGAWINKCKDSSYLYEDRWIDAIARDFRIVHKYFRYPPNSTNVKRLSKSLFDKDRITNPRMRSFNIKLDANLLHATGS
jgi:hypothetical protein